MSASAQFVLPGHREPLAAWSAERLESAREDFLFDLDNGFVPDAKGREALGHIEAELESRAERGDMASDRTAPMTLERALERWFDAERDVDAPAVIGEAREPTLALAAPMREQAASPEQALAANASVMLDDAAPSLSSGEGMPLIEAWRQMTGAEPGQEIEAEP